MERFAATSVLARTGTRTAQGLFVQGLTLAVLDLREALLHVYDVAGHTDLARTWIYL